ncbi:MAG: EAL domain-containing protein [Gammaproteobacteria bacterium]|nr:EAL domain-containing protein [Gammaproteobacteria bacterium]
MNPRTANNPEALSQPATAGRTRDLVPEAVCVPAVPPVSPGDAQLIAALELVSDGVVATDARGRIRFMNPAAEALTGWRAADADGESVDAVVSFLDPDGRHDVAPAVTAGARPAATRALIDRGGRKSHVSVAEAVAPAGKAKDTGRVLVLTDCTHVQRERERDAQEDRCDTLTGLLNRSAFLRHLDRALEMARRNRRQHVLCCLDLDQFKIVNDACGHTAGDELLRKLAIVIREHIPAGSTVGRLGGDEFGLLVENCALEDGRRIADGLRAVIGTFRFQWNGLLFKVGVSIGLVAIDASGGTADGLLSRADSACYVAKEGGRSRVHVFDPEDAAFALRQRQVQWAAAIEGALQNDQFRLFFQPIVATDRSGPPHAEILIRMEQDGVLVPPGEFLPAAERYCLSQRLDHWVVEAFCRAWSEHTAALEHVAKWSINLSGHSLSHEDTLRHVLRCFEVYAVPPERICFEITETAVISNLDTANRLMAGLRARGCTFALDDFGAGLSSFGYLKNLPVDYLKIDGALVRDVGDDPVSTVMVESINRIGHVLGKRTIAEYVDSERVLEHLAAMGVDYAQGFHIAMPRPLAMLFDASPLAAVARVAG